jgi:hypothetical protein
MIASPTTSVLFWSELFISFTVETIGLCFYSEMAAQSLEGNHAAIDSVEQWIRAWLFLPA